MTFTKKIAAVAALSVGTLAFAAAPAEAKKWHHHHHGGNYAAAGIVGFTAGALIGSALAQPQPRGYVVVDPSYDWVAYCSAKYRSFNSRTGLYRTYDGTYRECR